MNKVVERLVEGAKIFESLKEDCRGFEGFNINPSGELQVYLTCKKFKKLFDLYQIETSMQCVYLVREIDNVKFIAMYEEDIDDDF